MVDRICSVEGCGLKHYAVGVCDKHYKRIRKHGTIELPGKPSVEERFWAKVWKTETCWIWLGAQGATPKGQQGYGNFNCGARNFVRAHRWSYEQKYGAIPDGMHLDHTCFNRTCVNPDHLRVVNHRQNSENHRGARGNSASGVRGVYFDKSRNKWNAQVTHCGKVVYSNRFDELTDAEAAVIAARNALHTHNDRDRV